MSEKLQPQHGEHFHPTEHSTEIDTHHQEQSEHPHDVLTHATSEQLAHIKEQVERHAVRSANLRSHEHETTRNHPILINTQLKNTAFTRTMTRTRKQLNVPDRWFSQLIHIPAIDKVSNAIGSSIARPIPLFWGGLFACTGTSVLLWITRHYGYEYNYLVLFLLFGTGLVLGFGIEAIWRIFRHKQYER